MKDRIIKLKKDLQKRGISGIALDIDETLADSMTHWFTALYKFSSPEGMDLQEIMKKFRFAEHVPEWKTEEAFAYMEELTHSEEFNETAPLIEDSNHTVNKVNKIIPVVAYITARPEAVEAGTKRWLMKHGFPDATLITRSGNIELSDKEPLQRNSWKAEVLNYLYPEVLGIIDDNHVLAYELQKLNYKGTLYLYGNETDEFKDFKNVIVCPTWEEVLKVFTKNS